MMYSGMSSSWNGIICTSSIMPNTRPLPRKCICARAYPTSSPKITVKKMTPPVKMPELARPWSRLMELLMFV
ncbi:hypothetical protein D3C85_1769510 [compost metagenome]